MTKESAAQSYTRRMAGYSEKVRPAEPAKFRPLVVKVHPEQERMDAYRALRSLNT